MPIIRLGKHIRLTGKEAYEFLDATGRAHLPRTVEEYNSAIEALAAAWRSLEIPEGNLLAHLIECDQLIETPEGELTRRVDVALADLKKSSIPKTNEVDPDKGTPND